MGMFEIKERRLIPNWRDFKRTVQLGELSISNTNIDKVKINIDHVIHDWGYKKNAGTAAEMINACYISGIANILEVNEAIDFIHKNPKNSSESLLELINIISESSQQGHQQNLKHLLETDYETIEQFQSLINNKVLYKLINKTKNKIREEILNPINWIELARLYSINGQSDQAKPSVLTALHLAPDNRFILRSATRYFIHNGDYDQALYYLKKSKSLKKDPWLISAHIATSSLMNRYSPLIKTGISLTSSDQFSNFELTELSGSLGTLEFNAGSFKNAKRLFEKSMLSPNDNSLAQIEWIAKDDYRFKINLSEFDSVINPFEAYAIDKFEKGEWKEAFYNCLKWFSDTPFSKRPILLGCYLAGSLLYDVDAAITLCKIGLQANPHHVVLLNNIIYYSALAGKFEEIDHYFEQMNISTFEDLPENDKPVIQATAGLANFRRGIIDDGKKWYKLAILNSEKIKNEYFKNSAILNYTRELIISRQPERFEYIEVVKKMKLVNKDLIFIKENVLQLNQSSEIVI
jgi:tetratricopeptide (TPR) repeat protein